jgi:hypothetical protein
MKNWWKVLVGMVIPIVEAAGEAKKAEDDNDTGTDDVIGEGLIYLGHLAQWLKDGGVGNKPTVPSSLK